MMQDTEIKIDEIPEYSCLRIKNKKPKPINGKVKDVGNVKKDESFMQLTIGSFIIVYKLKKENRREIAML